jgi:hypothetical protein
MQRKVRCSLWRFQAHFQLHVKDRKQYIVFKLNFDKDNNFKCPLTLQQGNVQDHRFIHGWGGSPCYVLLMFAINVSK